MSTKQQTQMPRKRAAAISTDPRSGLGETIALVAAVTWIIANVVMYFHFWSQL